MMLKFNYNFYGNLYSNYLKSLYFSRVFEVNVKEYISQQTLALYFQSKHDVLT